MREKYGYFLEPKVASYKALAYRFQALKNEQTPKRIWQSVMAYFVGNLRFCGSFYFLRATAKQLDTIRFYYAMALSSILDMTVYETLGAACCKNASVSASAASFQKLLEITGMPSLRNIAIVDAGLVRQVWLSRFG